ncbi:hypothetical protein P7C73_g4697, partial [Tremellales sp. Uapishka_1]
MPNYRSRSRSRSPEYRHRAYSPSRAYPRSPPPRSRYDDHDFPPPRHGLPSMRDDYLGPEPTISRAGRYDYDERGFLPPPPPPPPYRREEQWERGRDVAELSAYPYHGGPADGRPPRGHAHGHGHGPVSSSPPSVDIILKGIDPELDEDSLSHYMRSQFHANIVSATVKRDKNTGMSRCFAFVKFATLEGAMEFFNQKWVSSRHASDSSPYSLPVFNSQPTITMPAMTEHFEAKRVKIDYATPQIGGGEGAGSYGYSGNAYGGGNRPHAGERDIGKADGGNRVLLLSQLDPGTSAQEILRRLGEEIARLVGKEGRGREAEATVARVVSIVHRESRNSWGFAFIELVTSQLACALLGFLMSPAHQPKGFCITGVPVAAAFAKTEAFLPTTAGPLGGEFVLRATRQGGIGCETVDDSDDHWCCYWHQDGGAVEVLPRGGSIAEDGSAPIPTKDMRIFIGSSLAGPIPIPKGLGSAASAGKPDEGGGAAFPMPTGPFTVKIGKTKRKDEDVMVPILQKNLLADEEDEKDVVGKDSVLLSRTKGAKVIPPMATSRKVKRDQQDAVVALAKTMCSLFSLFP